MARKSINVLFSLFAALSAVLVLAPVCVAAPTSDYVVFGRQTPTVVAPGGEVEIELNVLYLGSNTMLQSPEGSGITATVTDTLPEGLMPIGTTGVHYISSGESQCASIVGRILTCELLEMKKSGGVWASQVTIAARVESDVSGTLVDHATVTGGGALEPATTSVPITVGRQEPAAGIEHMEAFITNEEGGADTQAGSHPYELVTAFTMNTEVEPGEKANADGAFSDARPAGGGARNINVNLPPGIIGNSQAIPQCPRKDFISGTASNDTCPLNTEVGLDYVTTVYGITLVNPIYNLSPPPGVAAQLAVKIYGNEVFFDAGVRTGGDDGITVHTSHLPEENITKNIAVIWGTPADPSHDEERGGRRANGEVCKNLCPAEAPPVPYLTLPTSCQGPVEFSTEELGTWEDESYVAPRVNVVTHDNEGDLVGFTGCERLQPFKPEISIAPDTNYADTPAGLSVDVKMPQGLNPKGLQTPGLKGTTVVLPEGIAINPGQATGLVACQPSQEALGAEPDGEINEGPVSCPAASKVGTVEVSTPLLPDKLQGNVYVLGQNPPNLQLLMAASGDGVNLKLVGNVHLNENTGQLTTTFENTPDVPFTEFKLTFSGGAQAALATPTRCGTYESSTDFTPWSTPFIGDAFDTSRFQIANGPDGAPCMWPMGFAPSMSAGPTTDQAGGYTDFTMLLTRGDEQQRIKTLSFKTPEGLLGVISKVSPCGEPQAAQGTCLAASQIGHAVVGAGPGPYPFYIPQAGAPEAPIYLTGPYDGAPFGLSIVVPLIAGPFNLGTEVVRARIEVDPHTSQITITTNPLPLTEKGIPDDLRLIDAVIDRPEFMFNPTDCNPMSFTGTATSTEGASAPLTSHLQVGSCQSLKFAPDFTVSTSGKTSRADGASLTAKIAYPTGNLGDNQATSQANIASVKVDLPKQLPSRLTTLQKACPVQVFESNPAGCPAASIVGHAKAVTPVLPVPLEGPAYFVSHGGAKFPELIVVLQGDNVTVELDSETFISKEGITSSTFRQVPDVPVGTFELTLPEGPYSALAANGNLCAPTKTVLVKRKIKLKSKDGYTRTVTRKVKETVAGGGLEMPTAFTGQNGAVIHQNTPIEVTGCPPARSPARAKSKAVKANHGQRKKK
jgi:hypothetical protein